VGKLVPVRRLRGQGEIEEAPVSRRLGGYRDEGPIAERPVDANGAGGLGFPKDADVSGRHRRRVTHVDAG
jgi:hypothetical protein